MTKDASTGNSKVKIFLEYLFGIFMIVGCGSFAAYLLMKGDGIFYPVIFIVISAYYLFLVARRYIKNNL
jgi:hypothetical protein